MVPIAWNALQENLECKLEWAKGKVVEIYMVPYPLEHYLPSDCSRVKVIIKVELPHRHLQRVRVQLWSKCTL